MRYLGSHPSPLASVFLCAAFPALIAAQTSSFDLGTIYQCPGGNSFRVISCAGPGAGDWCDVQSHVNGRGNLSGKSTRQQVMTLRPLCHPQTPAEAQQAAQPTQAPGNGAAAAATGVGGFKVGDTVKINTAFGWMDAKVLRINGNSYYVHAQSGAEVWKPYPDELRRIGPINAEDRAHGVYELHDRVQALVDGRWEDGEIITDKVTEYEVKLAGNRSTWAPPRFLKFVKSAADAAPKPPAAGTPPKPGLVSCAGKFEGRYSSTGGLGGLSITFRSGKATMAGGLGDPEELECWTGGGKIILHKAGAFFDQDMPLDINNDGTLDTPLGEIKKKGN